MKQYSNSNDPCPLLLIRKLNAQLTNLVILGEFSNFHFCEGSVSILFYTHMFHNMTKYCSYNKFYKKNIF